MNPHYQTLTLPGLYHRLQTLDFDLKHQQIKPKAYAIQTGKIRAEITRRETTINAA